ncbi:serine/threonine-protein kinase ATR [Pancytospora epiphaga]|nr:serine/threonine-protein kinase ATR [Pancytospora epiphaga]
MKCEYYKRLYFFELKTKRALDVFRLSLSKVKSYDLFDAIVQRLLPDELEKFFELVESTTYDLAKTKITDLLYKIPLSRQAFTALCRLDIGILRMKTPPTVGIYNYCYYKKRMGNYSTVDIAEDLSLDGCVGVTNAYTVAGENIDESKGYSTRPGTYKFIFTTFREDELVEFKKVLKEICIRNRESKLLREYIRQYVKDDLLLAILDKNGRVSGLVHPAKDLLLLDDKQVYNLPDTAMVEISLCKANYKQGECTICHNVIYSERLKNCKDEKYSLNEHETNQITKHLDTALLGEDLGGVCNILLHFPSLCNTRILKAVLRTYGAYKGTRQVEHYGYNGVCINDTVSPGMNVARVLNALSFTGEDEETIISFLKSKSCRFEKVLRIIPSFLKNKCLKFACFAVMIDEVLKGTAPYRMMCIRTLVYKHESIFNDAMDMIIAYYYERWTTIKRNDKAVVFDRRKGGIDHRKTFLSDSLDGVVYPDDGDRLTSSSGPGGGMVKGGKQRLFRHDENGGHFKAINPVSVKRQRILSQEILDSEFKPVTNEKESIISQSNRDRAYLNTAFSALAKMYSTDSTDFVWKYFSLIFVAVYKDKEHISEGFRRENAHHIVIKKIMDCAPPFECNDVRVMVGIMFNGNFDHSAYFTPTLMGFIQNNLSQILFEIKKIYKNEKHIYPINTFSDYLCPVDGKPHVIYKILRHLFENIDVSLYFNYIWPTVEYFINKERCRCGMGLVDWMVECGYYNILQVPYMYYPFENIEEFPLIPGIENKLYPILMRFFYSKELGIDKNILKSIDIFSEGFPIAFKVTFEEYFIEKFLSYFSGNSVFKHKILDIFPACPPRMKALLGNLGKEHRSAVLMKAPENIPHFILEHFLLRIDHNHLELYSFVIQEFLKNINEPLKPEVENIVEQFRRTRYALRDTEKILGDVGKSLRVDGSYLDFLRTLLNTLSNSLNGYKYLSYLILFDASILEYSCLCLIKLCYDKIPGYSIDWLVCAINEYYRDFFSSDYGEMLRFMLKVNMFVGVELCKKKDCLNYYLVLKDYYGVIQLLDGAVETDSERALLQLAYLRIGDITRVKELNKRELVQTAVTLFVEFAREWNFKAALECYSGFIKENTYEVRQKRLGTNSGNEAIASIMNEILAMNEGEDGGDDYCNPEHGKMLMEACTDKEGEFAIWTGSNSVGSSYTLESTSTKNDQPNTTSIMSQTKNEIDKKNIEYIKDNKDIFLDRKSRDKRKSGFPWPVKDKGPMFHISMDCFLIKNSKNLEATLEILNKRRGLAENKETIIKMHLALAGYLGVSKFLKTVEMEYIKLLRLRGDYTNCMVWIARLLIRQEWDALYECAMLKLDKKEVSEAKVLLNRATKLCKPGTRVYLKAAMKLCELNGDVEAYKRYIKAAEENLLGENTQKTGIPERIIVDIGRHSNESNTKTSAQAELIKSHCNYKYILRLYFGAAKLLEKVDLLRALSYYQRCFNDNYGAVPRFFHLISKLHYSQIPKVDSMISDVIKYNISAILPYYTQISNRLGLNTESLKFYADVTRAMLEFSPHETFWDTLILANSRSETLRSRVQALISELPLENRVLFKNTERIAEQFTKISRSKSKTISMDEFEIKTLLPSTVSVPGRKTRINGIKDEIFVFISLQRPKRIILLGDDGVEYPMIVKYKDDLRKDSRMMELGTLLNKLFADGYYIRTYRVIPFSHESGIIEYLPGLTSLKKICSEYYTHINEVVTSFAKHRRIGGNNIEKVLKLFPPVLHGWMKKQHPDPYTFYSRRENYTRTYAIMCVVGWFIGLGDRHAENTHFDLSSGDTVQVDLNCIFDKGTGFEIPERVPFRLTRNIIDGFGCLGVEGPFRNTMEYTLELLKRNGDVVLSNMLSFVFDPLFEWARKKNESERILERLETRLKFVSEEETAEALIQAAVSLNNLGSMYIGWMPFL